MRIYRISQQVITAYHGTCSSYYDVIEEKGLIRPYLAKTYELARYYAEQIPYNRRIPYDYGDPIVLNVIITDTNNLRYDSASMDEPIMASEEDRDRAWEQAAIEHPEWVEDGMIIIPSTEWEVSWYAVGAVKYEGTIPPEQISVAL